jgi:hypothetical protein
MFGMIRRTRIEAGGPGSSLDGYWNLKNNAHPENGSQRWLAQVSIHTKTSSARGLMELIGCTGIIPTAIQ